MPFKTPIPPFPTSIPIAQIHTVDMDALLAGDTSAAQAVYAAATGSGFFYLKNHHVDSAFMFTLAQRVFTLPLAEKMKYDMGATGHYYGYKRAGGFYTDDKGTPDHSEFYNVSKDEVLSIGDAKSTPHPDVVRESFDELQQFMRACHRVVSIIVRTLGQQLGLDPELLPSMHRVDQPSCCQARVTHAPPITEETIALGEHSDFGDIPGSVTVLFNTGLGGLQALDPNSREWKYVQPRPEYAVINLGDAFVKLVGGRLYSAVHRVIGPPGEQARMDRHSVVYFSRPNSSVMLRSLFKEDPEDEGEPMNADDWVANRAKTWASANYKDKDSYRKSRGTEHNRDANRNITAALEKPPEEIKAA